VSLCAPCVSHAAWVCAVLLGHSATGSPSRWWRCGQWLTHFRGGPSEAEAASSSGCARRDGQGHRLSPCSATETDLEEQGRDRVSSWPTDTGPKMDQHVQVTCSRILFSLRLSFSVYEMSCPTYTVHSANSSVEKGETEAQSREVRKKPGAKATPANSGLRQTDAGCRCKATW
jgi:hypothetical protein